MLVEEYFNTDYITMANKPGVRFCPYCGKEIKPRDAFDEGAPYVYYKCDCEDAINAYTINKKIEQLRYQLPRPKYKVAERIVPYEE